MEFTNLLTKIILMGLIINILGQTYPKPDAIPNNQYKQAPIPPNILVIQDMPQYGLKGLEKWEDYVQGNLKMIKDFKIRHNRAMLNMYKNRMSKIAEMSKDINIMELGTNIDRKLPIY